MDDQKINRLPVLISYPRSGSNWFNSVMELYFNRPRLRVSPSSFLPDIHKRKDYMWFHDHDIHSSLNLSHKNIAYLYRNPTNVIYSLLMAEHNCIKDELINKQIHLLSNHYKKYIINKGAKIIIKYENLKNTTTYYEEFNKFVSFFGINKYIDKAKLDKCISIVKKDVLISKNKNNVYFTKKLETKEYSDNREMFREKYNNHIETNLLNNKLKKIFN